MTDPWLTLLDAVVLIARTFLPEAWARYCTIAVAVERIPSDEDAGRARLLKPQAHKLLEAWGSDRAGEACRLETQFAEALLGELRAGRWQGQATSEREGLLSAIVAPTTWHVSGIEVDTATGSILRDGTPWLLGMLLQPVNDEERRPKHRQPAGQQRDPGPPKGTTNPIEREREALVPLLRAKRREGESRRATVARLYEAGEFTKLPGTLIAEGYNRITELARVWAKMDREDGIL